MAGKIRPALLVIYGGVQIRKVSRIRTGIFRLLHLGFLNLTKLFKTKLK